MNKNSMEYTDLGSLKFHKEPSKGMDVTGNMIKKWFLFAVVAAVVVLIVFGFGKLIGGGRYDSAIKKYIEFISDSFNGKGKANKLAKQYPKYMEESIRDYCDTLDDIDISEYASAKITYKITNKTRIKGEELERYQSDISEYVDEDKKVKVQSGYLFEVKIKAKLRNKESGEKDEEEFDCKMLVLRCNGKTGVWKIDGRYVWEV